MTGSPHFSSSTRAPGRPSGLLRVRGPAELVAALPTLLGFHPRRSLLLVSTGAPLPLVVRVDLPDAVPREPDIPQPTESSVVELAVAGIMRVRPAAVLAIVVDDRVGDGTDPRWQPLATRLIARLQDVAVEVLAVVWTSGTETGSRWHSRGGGGEHSGEWGRPSAGVVPDSSSLPYAAAAAAAGTVVYADRTDLERLVTAADRSRLRRRERLLARAAEDGNSVPVDPTAAGEVVTAALADAAAGTLRITDERVVALARALGVRAVRDDVVGMLAAHGGARGPSTAAAEGLWAALSREFPDPVAAVPATLLAVSALLRGDGALANVALDRAEQAWPGYRFGRLLRAAAGLRPEEFRSALLYSAGATVDECSR